MGVCCSAALHGNRHPAQVINIALAAQEAVRKKAVMALHWFHTLDPTREGPLLGLDIDRHFRTMLCDRVRLGRAMGCARLHLRGC